VSLGFTPVSACRCPRVARVGLGLGGAALLCAVLLVGVRLPRSRAESGTLTVHDAVLGQTTTYIGATEGGYFDIADLNDCGINTYRIWIGMSDVEYCDDDDSRGSYEWECTQTGNLNYGTPTSAAIKADTDVISWTVWDEHIDNPAYRWRTGNNPDTAFGAVVGDLQASGILPVLTLRNRDEFDWPAWAPNPPVTADDLEEWWQYCFAVAYWFNVRNNYGVTHFEVHNEPDLVSQGWGGNQLQYVQLVSYAYDAVKTANDLAGIETHVHAPVVANYASGYVAASLDNADGEIDVVDYHTYAGDPLASILGISATIAAHNPDGVTEPIWVSEWGTYDSSYDDFGRAMLTADQLLTFSEQGVQGVNIFTFYDWGSVSGLVQADGTRTETYYAYRLMTRGLVGGKERLDHTAGSLGAGTRTMITRDAQYVYVVVLRDSVGMPGTLNVDMTAIGSGSGTVTVWEYSAASKDVVVETPAMTDAAFSFTIPADGIALAQVDRSALAVRVSDLRATPGGWPWAALAVLVLAVAGACFVAWRRWGGGTL
jgi:hypothetical protein